MSKKKKEKTYWLPYDSDGLPYENWAGGPYLCKTKARALVNTGSEDVRKIKIVEVKP